jgi:lipoprotein-anchoring transpeptidase ErfK/SrfK
VPCGAAAPAQAADVAVLLEAKTAREFPSLQAPVVQRVAARRPITRTPTSLPVLSDARDGANREWLEVRLPGRPNGVTGWILKRRTVLDRVRQRIAVDLSARTVTFYDRGRRVRRMRAVVGAPATPTPVTASFVEEIVRYRRPGKIGPYAIALAARSPVFTEFEGGPGQVAIHGRGRLGGTPGTAASNGCLRLRDRDVAWLARRVIAGTPVTISG